MHLLANLIWPTKLPYQNDTTLDKIQGSSKAYGGHKKKLYNEKQGVLPTDP
jgi:hypothetical protein